MANSKSTPRICEQCHAPFMTVGRRGPRLARFCSSACGYEHRRRPMQVRFWEKVDRSGGPDACWPFTAQRDPDGYGKFRSGQTTRAHRVAWELTFGPIPPGFSACHRCDNPSCCNPAHLFLGTNAENTADRDAKGRQARGDRSGPRLYPERLRRGGAHYAAKLAETQVVEIRSSSDGSRALAKKYSVSRSTVRHIRTRQSWKHLP